MCMFLDAVFATQASGRWEKPALIGARRDLTKTSTVVMKYLQEHGQNAALLLFIAF